MHSSRMHADRGSSHLAGGGLTPPSDQTPTPPPPKDQTPTPLRPDPPAPKKELRKENPPPL